MLLNELVNVLGRHKQPVYYVHHKKVQCFRCRVHSSRFLSIPPFFLSLPFFWPHLALLCMSALSTFLPWSTALSLVSLVSPVLELVLEGEVRQKPQEKSDQKGGLQRSHAVPGNDNRVLNPPGRPGDQNIVEKWIGCRASAA
jgi:hypothetical protein